jgi:hypothetical protein
VAQVEIADGSLVVSVTGVDKLLALKSRLEVPLEHVAGVELRPEVARTRWHGFRLPGTNIPGVVTAGSFYQSGEWVFWDVHDPDKTVAIQLRDEHYTRLVIQVDDPEVTAAALKSAMRPPSQPE